ncbi:RusA family crossover junction endodeoxyribonuclease [Oceanicaulis alexandrii]|uniref:RusA family crossover junction endodeoxyribonuclease n=1 Tax=Oceanicaulis alexandrii TaxID=153233 RepID=UPI0035CEE4DB
MQASATEGALNVRVDAPTSQSRQFKDLIAAYFRTEFKRVGPRYGAFEIEIEIEHGPDSPVHDVDSVARAVVEALTGIVFHDDSQVQRLHVEKTTGERDRVKVRARPIGDLIEAAHADAA